MSDPSYVVSLKQAYRVWEESKGTDPTVFLDLMDDNIDFQSLADGAEPMGFTAHRTGKERVQGYLDGLIQDWEMVFYRAETFIVQDEHVVMRGTCRWRSRSTGKEVETPKADFWLFRNGKAVSFMEFFDTAKAFAGMQP